MRSGGFSEVRVTAPPLPFWLHGAVRARYARTTTTGPRRRTRGAVAMAFLGLTTSTAARRLTLRTTWRRSATQLPRCCIVGWPVGATPPELHGSAVRANIPRPEAPAHLVRSNSVMHPTALCAAGDYNVRMTGKVIPSSIV